MRRVLFRLILLGDLSMESSSWSLSSPVRIRRIVGFSLYLSSFFCRLSILLCLELLHQMVGYSIDCGCCQLRVNHLVQPHIVRGIVGIIEDSFVSATTECTFSSTLPLLPFFVSTSEILDLLRFKFQIRFTSRSIRSRDDSWVLAESGSHRSFWVLLVMRLLINNRDKIVVRKTKQSS